MMTATRLGAGLSAIAALALAACGDKASDDSAKTTTRLDAVEVPQGTISDELMPLDTRNESSAGSAVSTPAETADGSAAPQPNEPAASDRQGDATDSESETDQ